jgi:hypothetical protein
MALHMLHVTSPVGKYPFSTAVHVVVVGDPTMSDLGTQETAIFDAFGLTVRVKVPE